jgi:hypothetical protein
MFQHHKIRNSRRVISSSILTKCHLFQKAFLIARQAEKARRTSKINNAAQEIEKLPNKVNGRSIQYGIITHVINK